MSNTSLENLFWVYLAGFSLFVLWLQLKKYFHSKYRFALIKHRDELYMAGATGKIDASLEAFKMVYHSFDMSVRISHQITAKHMINIMMSKTDFIQDIINVRKTFNGMLKHVSPEERAILLKYSFILSFETTKYLLMVDTISFFMLNKFTNYLLAKRDAPEDIVLDVEKANPVIPYMIEKRVERTALHHQKQLHSQTA